MINKEPDLIKKMFDKIAPSYDFLNNIISFFTHYQVKKTAIKALKIKPNSKVLDLCCGTGDLSRIAKQQEPSCEIIGADFSQKMIDIAVKKSSNIKFITQDATNLEFDDNSFDYVITSFGLRNIQNRQLALKEIYRVQKKDGYFMHLDFGNKNFINKIYDAIIKIFTKAFFKDKDAYLYLLESKNEFPQPKLLAEEFQNTGFKIKAIKYCCFNMISFQICHKD